MLTDIDTLPGELKRSDGSRIRVVADHDAIRRDLYHGGREAVRAHGHVVHALAREEVQMLECPRDIEADIGERSDVGPGEGIASVGAERHLVVVDDVMVANSRV